MKNIYLVSDSSGETLETLLEAAVNQFEQLEVKKHLKTMVRSYEKVDELITEALTDKAMILHTMSYNKIREYLIERCDSLGIICLCPLQAIVDLLREHFSHINNTNLRKAPGKYLKLDSLYYERVKSLYFTLHHDDGCNINSCNQADIILLGISRTSKTPISLYLAHRGYKVANIPLVKHNEEKLYEICRNIDRNTLVVGLTISLKHLIKIRSVRENSLYSHRQTLSDYSDDYILSEEIKSSLLFFDKLRIKTIDITRRSIEEISAEILNLI